MRFAHAIATACAVLASLPAMPAQPNESTPGTRPVAFHRITVVDEQTSRGIPCVELKTPDSRVFTTDSAGVVAFCEPDLMGKNVFFSLKSFGYLFPANFIGQRGRAIDIDAGGSSTLAMKRINVAQRLYRVTGSGIYRDSMLLGDDVPHTQDDTRTPVTGMDSVQSAIHRGKMYWFWGDTSMSMNPLGNFKTTGAISPLPGAGLDPDKGVPLTFFREGTRVRPMFDDEHKPIWVGGIRVVSAPQGGEQLCMNYAKVDGQTMASLEQGLAVFDHEAQRLRIDTVYPKDPVILPHGHAFPCEERGAAYFYYADPMPFVRSAATPAAIRDLSTFEAFTCVKQGARFTGNAEELDRNADGSLRWAWKRNTSAPTGAHVKTMLEKRLIRPEEAPWMLRDANTTATVLPHSGSVYFNEYRKRWVSIRSESFSPVSFLGETWYFEADTPLGPWTYGQKILTHRHGEKTIDSLTWSTHQADTYSFYNPLHHPEFDRDGGRTIYFEGTYTMGFSGSTVATPGYDYNQIMYRLDLDDPRLFLPVAVYRVEGDGAGAVYRTKDGIPEGRRDVRLAFFAPDRPRPGTVPVYEAEGTAGKAARLSLEAGSSATSGTVVFHAVSAAAELPPHSPLVPLFEYVSAAGDRLYTTDGEFGGKGYTKQPRPLCRVWPAPVQFDPLRMELAATDK